MIERLLDPRESMIEGGYTYVGGILEFDANALRIEWLIENSLKKVTTDTSGWYILYQDLTDKRYWELSYPQSELHGGGAPRLEYINIEKAKLKYPI